MMTVTILEILARIIRILAWMALNETDQNKEGVIIRRNHIIVELNRLQYEPSIARETGVMRKRDEA